MAFTQDQLTALETAIASGTLEVRIGDKMVRYQSIADLIKARDLVLAELDTGLPSNRSTYSAFFKD